MSDDLELKLWDFASARFVENLLSTMEPYNFWQQEEFREWITSGDIYSLDEGVTVDINNKIGVLLSGQIYKSGQKRKVERAPALLENGDIIAEGTSRVFTADKKDS